jgi:hypothetical protein
VSDVYKFRVTVDLEIATHEHPTKVRDWLKTAVEDRLAVQDSSIGIIDQVIAYHVRTKRLDNWARLGPPVNLRIAAIACPHCASTFADVQINYLPFKCPVCGKDIPIKGDVR